MKEIKLYNGSYTIVDDDVYDEFKSFKFYDNGKGHVYRNSYVNNSGVTLYLHREITGAPKGMQVDHIDGNPLNNQRSNLRIVTRAQNLHNVGKQKGKYTSKYKGVCWVERDKAWHSTICDNKKNIKIGLFSTEEAAAHAYNNYVKNNRDNIAYLNKLPDDYEWESKRIPNRREGVGKSKYIGVSWSKAMNKWQCHIMVNYKSIFLGCFEDEKEAANKYNDACIKYRGEKAKLNMV